MSENFQGLNDLEAAVAAISRATTPSEIFRTLLTGTACAAPRAVVFLLREHRWKGWGATGYGTAEAMAARSVSMSDQDGWLARAAASEDRWIVASEDGDAPRFGPARPETALAFPVRVGGKAVAAVLAERGTGERPWHPEALAVLVHAVRLRLEFDLAWRRLRAAGVSRGDAAGAGDSGPSPVSEAPAADAAALQMTPWDEPSPPAAVDPQEAEARRFARLVATDIRLYNEEAVAHGRIEGDLAFRLQEQLQKGRESFERRFPGLGRQGMSILRESYVQVLAGGDASLIPPD